MLMCHFSRILLPQAFALIFDRLLGLALCYTLLQGRNGGSILDGGTVRGNDLLDNVTLMLGGRPAGND